ncbi:hypothetical protein [Rufibacter latericius]|uniref:HTTM domain-containing protein n=1 Tax=Rufibacter latericius TaxID=2487040 RepID=A0A3M9MGB3_9BACT|nr:hypothetical protein [Rufibacter latericius]RNI23688.1 hypothetical protein EFB08_19385 [Rufibacter latericius]
MEKTVSRQQKTSEHGRFNQHLRAVVDFYYAELFLRLLTFVWLYWALTKFHLYLDRPPELYEPLTLLGRLAAPVLPAKEIFWTVVALAALANFSKLFRKRALIPQVLLAASLLWINLVLWSYGYLPHVNHLFLLAHLFLIFVAVERPGKNRPDQIQYATINWFYFGLLFVYTLSGLWKIAALAKKLLSSSAAVHWLRPEAALYNALVSFRDYDQPFRLAQLFVDFPGVWQLGFVATVYFLTSAVAAAWHPPLRPWVGGLLICFHLINQFAFLIFFVVACLTLLCLFFPYGAVFRQSRTQYRFPAVFLFSGRKQEAAYFRQYEDGQEDAFFGFEAYRQKLLDWNYYQAGFLYFPGIKILTELTWRLTHRSGREKASI